MLKVLSHELPCLAPKDLESISGQLFGGRKRFWIMAQQGHHREKKVVTKALRKSPMEHFELERRVEALMNRASRDKGFSGRLQGMITELETVPATASEPTEREIETVSFLEFDS